LKKDIFSKRVKHSKKINLNLIIKNVNYLKGNVNQCLSSTLETTKVVRFYENL